MFGIGSQELVIIFVRSQVFSRIGKEAGRGHPGFQESPGRTAEPGRISGRPEKAGLPPDDGSESPQAATPRGGGRRPEKLSADRPLDRRKNSHTCSQKRIEQSGDPPPKNAKGRRWEREPEVLSGEGVRGTALKASQSDSQARR